MSRNLLPLLCTGAVVLLCAPPVQAQSKVICSHHQIDGVTPRLEGTRELLPQLRLSCSGGTAGETLTTDLVLELNVNITGRRTGDFSEALLLIGTAPLSAGVSLVQGVLVNSKRIRFSFSLTAPGPNSSLALRVVNLRADVSVLPPAPGQSSWGEVVTSIAFTNPRIVAAQSRVLITSVAKGLVHHYVSHTPDAKNYVGACGPHNPSFPARGEPTLLLVYVEGSMAAFRTAAETDGSHSIPETHLFTESGFFDPSLPTDNGLRLAGRATQATRLMARFRNVPAGIAVYVSTKQVAGSRGSGVAELIGPGGAIIQPSANAMLSGGLSGVVAVPITAGTGEAVWEVTSHGPRDHDLLLFAVMLSFTGPVEPGLISIDMGFAPADAAETFPAFVPLSERRFGIRACFTSSPDLRIVPNTTGFSAAAGDTVPVSFVVENLGAASPPFNVHVRHTQSDIDLGVSPGSRIISAPALPPGASVTLKTDIVLDDSLSPSDSNRIFVSVNHDQKVPEYTSLNNVYQYPLHITSCSFDPLASGAVVSAGTPGFPVNIPPFFATRCHIPWISDSPWLTPSHAIANETGTARTGYLSAHGFRFRVTQRAASNEWCAAAFLPDNLATPRQGSAGTFEIASSNPCRWHIASTADWLQVSTTTGTGDAQVGYTVFPNFTTRSRSATVQGTDAHMTVTQEAGAGSPDERFIRLLYFNFMGRLPTDAEVAFQLNNTLRLGWTRAELATTFFNSAEFNNGGRFTAGLYVGLLNRNAEYGGWLYQRNALATNVVSPLQLVAGFIGSPEYTLKFGSPDNAAFVRLLYRHVLLREATQAEVNFQAGALTSGTTRAQIATNFLNSAEFRAGTGPRLTAFLLYSTLLFRDASSTEFETTRGQVATGANVTGLIHSFTSGPEFARVLE